MTKDEALRLALEFVEANHSGGPDAFELIDIIKATLEANEFNPDWDTQAVLTEEIQRMAKRIEELEAKDEPVAWSEDFDAMPFNTYCKAIVDWYSHSRDGDSFLEGRDVEVIIVKYESGEDEYDTVFIHEGNKQYAYTRCEVSKWKPLYAYPFKE